MKHPDPAKLARLPYRRGVGIMLLDQRHHVLVAQRLDMPSAAWQMPQGGIDEGETPLEAAWREMEEEIGTAKAELIAESRDWHHYDLPADLVPKLWHGRYRGQRQKWFAMRFTGDDSDIDLATTHPEFDAWKWVSPEQIADVIVSFKRQLYFDILTEFHIYCAAAKNL